MRPLRNDPIPEPVEEWTTRDIAEYCNINMDKANDLHMIANKVYGVQGYGDIPKDDFLEFLDYLEQLKENQRLQNEANSATILMGQKNLRWQQFSFFISQALNLLKP